ncbi:hypothetical protein BFP97_04630 [Roseivirga sp. 4D4]|uniref:hypothetical protein n=1 Tax=Roseivirga sp. 4D4 TaxID=1889784 RepID=UPI0008530211|nr:hypothetical protein [Roseivirga sp. 4D4]OEK00837.1 hypothetical protein BFP97_04630 [Roseivirga sp. 4D4]
MYIQKHHWFYRCRIEPHKIYYKARNLWLRRLILPWSIARRLEIETSQIESFEVAPCWLGFVISIMPKQSKTLGSEKMVRLWFGYDPQTVVYLIEILAGLKEEKKIELLRRTGS